MRHVAIDDNRSIIERAGQFVAEYGRYSNARVPPARPYQCRYPANASRQLTAPSVELLVQAVARKMRRIQR